MDALLCSIVLGHPCLASVLGSPSSGTDFSLKLTYSVPPRLVVFG